tara:strand:- start:2719 stop:3600 length:882 start_codon:yes stop_codon:yes gene_type:complete
VNLFLTVLQIVAPVGLLALSGFIWQKAGFEYRIEFVTRLAMTLATPCLMFTGLMKAQITPAALTTMLAAAVAAYGVLTLGFWALTAVIGLERRTYLNPLIFGNTGNLGLPLALFAFGQAGLGYAIVVFAVAAIWGFTFGVWLVSSGGSPLRVFREPLVWGALLGTLFLSQGWQTPLWLTNSLDLIGQMAIPLMLLTLGVAVARLKPRHLGRAAWLSLLRAGFCVAIGWTVSQIFGLEPIAAAVLILQISTPIAVTTYMLAEKYGADSEAVAGLVIVSTLLSVASLPLTLAFLV